MECKIKGRKSAFLSRLRIDAAVLATTWCKACQRLTNLQRSSAADLTDLAIYRKK
jgi:hypothetical protein